MEDYEEQEVEFWRKLDEEDISRGTMLRRSAAAAFGLTVLGGSSSALAATRVRSAAAPPSFGSAANMPTLIANAKKEGHLNTIALPPDWANYGEMIVDLPEEVRHQDHQREPGRRARPTRTRPSPR